MKILEKVIRVLMWIFIISVTVFFISTFILGKLENGVYYSWILFSILIPISGISLIGIVIASLVKIIKK